MLTRILPFIALLGPFVCSGASNPSDVFALDFTSLPSEQGFSFNSTSPPESSIFSVSGGILTQNSLGAQDRAFHYTYASEFPYTNAAFRISFRARLVETEGRPLDLGFAALFQNA